MEGAHETALLAGAAHSLGSLRSTGTYCTSPSRCCRVEFTPATLLWTAMRGRGAGRASALRSTIYLPERLIAQCRRCRSAAPLAGHPDRDRRCRVTPRRLDTVPSSRIARPRLPHPSDPTGFPIAPSAWRTRRDG